MWWEVYSDGHDGESLEKLRLSGDCFPVIFSVELLNSCSEVYLVPEAATLLINGGVDFVGEMTHAHRTQAQMELMKIQAAFEDGFARIAK